MNFASLFSSSATIPGHMRKTTCLSFGRMLIISVLLLLSAFGLTDRLQAQTSSAMSLINEDSRTVMNFYKKADSAEVRQSLNTVLKFFNNAQYEQGLTIVNRMIQADSSVWPLYLMSGAIYLATEDFDNCIRHCNLTLDYQNVPELMALRGMAYFGNEDFDNARKDIEKATKNGNYYFLHGLWAAHLAEEAECAEAFKYISLAKQKAPNALTCYYAARAFVLCDQVDSALNNISQSLRLEKTLDSYKFRSLIYAYNQDQANWQADQDSILLLLDTLLTYHPDNISLFQEKYRQLMSMSQFGRADTLLDQWLVKRPTIDIYLAKYNTYKEMGREKDADLWMQKAYALDSNNIEMTQVLIELSTENRDYKNTIRLCNKIIDAPGGSYSKDELAYAYHKRGNAK